MFCSYDPRNATELTLRQDKANRLHVKNCYLCRIFEIASVLKNKSFECSLRTRSLIAVAIFGPRREHKVPQQFVWHRQRGRSRIGDILKERLKMET